MNQSKNQKLRRRELQFLRYGSLFLLIVCALLFINPSASADSYAEDDMAIPLSTEIGIKSQTVISLALANQINLEVVPKSTGATSFGSTQLSISTNSNDGYSLYLQAGDDGERSDGSLLPATNTLTSKITNTAKQSAPLFDASNPDNSIGPNSYGYALSKDAITEGALYSHIPANADSSKVVLSVDSATNTSGAYPYGDTYHLAFGTNIDTSLPAGQYSGTVTVSAIANPKTLTSLYDITYMQDISPEICANTRTGYTKQLIDNRDGNSYWVAKLADERCWMTQNLAYTITQEMINNGSINSTNTDLQPNPTGVWWGQLYADDSGIIYWNNNDAVTYKATPTYHDLSIVGGGSASYNDTRSWDLGDYVLLNPTSFEACISDLKTSGQASSISILQGGSIDSCMNVVNVSGWTPTFTAREATIARDDFVRKTVSGYDSTESDKATTQTIWIPRSEATSGADQDEAGNYIPYTYTGLVSVDFTSKTYDPHYLLGNYYQYNVSTAGTAGGRTGELADAPSTICPKGWTLPRRWTSSAGDYTSLFTKYQSVSNVLLSTHLFPGGLIGNVGFLRLGATGHFPLKSMGNQYPNDAYNLVINSNSSNMLDIQHSWMRPSGFTIRCLARYE